MDQTDRSNSLDTAAGATRSAATRDDNDNANEWQCAICMDEINDPSIGGACTHHFCNDCLSRWSRTKHATCPVCRAPLLRILRDPEFASSIGVKSGGASPGLERQARGKCERRVSVDWPAGISFGPGARLDTTTPPRLIVRDVVPHNGAARAGIRAGDVVLRVNGVALTDPEMAVQLIDRQSAFGSVLLDVTRASADALRGAVSGTEAGNNARAEGTVDLPRADIDDDGESTSTSDATSASDAMSSSARASSPSSSTDNSDEGSSAHPPTTTTNVGQPRQLRTPTARALRSIDRPMGVYMRSAGSAGRAGVHSSALINMPPLQADLVVDWAQSPSDEAPLRPREATVRERFLPFLL